MDDKSYIAVFFDVDLPMLPNEARQIRLTKEKYNNLVKNKECIELVDKSRTLKYSIVSKRIFHLKNSVDNTMFLICDVKELKESGLLKWLSEQKELQIINKFFYRFWFNEKWCTGKVTITSEYEELTIMPNFNIHDIGNGQGVPVYKKFKRL